MPLFLVFENADPMGEKEKVKIIFKAGDDRYGIHPMSQHCYHNKCRIQQDAVSLHMLAIMDKIWSAGGLDMCLTIYSCVSVNSSTGIIEVACFGEDRGGGKCCSLQSLGWFLIISYIYQVVSDAATTAEIQKEYAGVTGALKKTPLSQWLKDNCHSGKWRCNI